MCLAGISLMFAAGATALAPTPRESQTTYEQQLAGGQIQAVTINKRLRTLHLTLKSGRHVIATYAPHEEPQQAAKIKAKGVAVTVETPAEAELELKSKPVHHKLRYIAAGIVVLVIVVVGGVLLIDRRRKRE